MPRYPNRRPRRAVAIQLPLFTEAAWLVRARPERGEHRFYRLEVWPDLFGRALLLHHWGRVGTSGRHRREPHPDPGAAINALARTLHAKRRLGYQDRAA